jgi:predicted Rossmann fold nucleotide-binding protein DprA/Smf involved in DNA uptake
METLRCGGKTIAVMGTPIDECYPTKHIELKEQIVRQGLVISQFEPGKPVSRGNFPQRNELMAAISVITLVAEAGPTSGTRHQVACALKLGRRVGFLASLTAKGIPWVDEAISTGRTFVVNQPEDIFKELRNFIPELPLPIADRKPRKDEESPAVTMSQLELAVDVADSSRLNIGQIPPEALKSDSSESVPVPVVSPFLPIEQQETVTQSSARKPSLFVSIGAVAMKWFGVIVRWLRRHKW